MVNQQMNNQTTGIINSIMPMMVMMMTMGMVKPVMLQLSYKGVDIPPGYEIAHKHKTKIEAYDLAMSIRTWSPSGKLKYDKTRGEAIKVGNGERDYIVIKRSW